MVELVVLSLLNGLVYGLLLFMLSSGLTLVFSMMGVLNFAHASMYMLGAYFAYSLTPHVGFWAALALAPFMVALLGAVIERFGLRNVHRHGHVAELLFTFGLAYLIEEGVHLVWGRNPVDQKPPAILDQALFTVFTTDFSAFKVFMLVVAIGMFVALWMILTRTRIGLIVQAALTHPNMVGALGHDVPLVFMGVFAVGAALAGLAGVLGGIHFVTNPGMALALGPIVFVVIVVGGLGSLGGAFLASLLIGVLQTLAVALDVSLLDFFRLFGAEIGRQAFGYDMWSVKLSQMAPMLPYLLLVLMLIFRPKGLMGSRES
ncbi:MAG: branched-chain amino acid ABC transporter permease [Alphaproteobacteria bacterium]|nr:branched-chain amino acid ABC transporter permease [Alphaproteobacteria bacterium]